VESSTHGTPDGIPASRGGAGTAPKWTVAGVHAAAGGVVPVVEPEEDPPRQPAAANSTGRTMSERLTPSETISAAGGAVVTADDGLVIPARVRHLRYREGQ